MSEATDKVMVDYPAESVFLVPVRHIGAGWCAKHGFYEHRLGFPGCDQCACKAVLRTGRQ